MKNLFSSPWKLLIPKLLVVTGCLFVLGCSNMEYTTDVIDTNPDCVELGIPVEIELSFEYSWDRDCSKIKNDARRERCNERCKKKSEKKLEKYTFENINVDHVSAEGVEISSKEYSWSTEPVIGYDNGYKVNGILSFTIPESINPDDYADGFIDVEMEFTQEATKERSIGKDKIVEFSGSATESLEVIDKLIAWDLKVESAEDEIYNTIPWTGNCAGGYDVQFDRDPLGVDFNTAEDEILIFWDNVYLLPSQITSVATNEVHVISQPGERSEMVKIYITNTPHNYFLNECNEDCDPCWDFFYDQTGCPPPPDYSWDWKTDFSWKGQCYVEIGNAIEDANMCNDIILVSQEANMVSIYERDCSGNPTSITGLDILHTSLPGQASALAVGLFDDNIYVDAAITLVNGDVIVLLNDGAGFTTPTDDDTYTAGISPNDVVIADINGDGERDIVVSSKGGDNSFLTILIGDGNGNFDNEAWDPIDLGKIPVAIIDGNFDDNFKGQDIAVLLEDNSVKLYTSEDSETSGLLLKLSDEYISNESDDIDFIDIESGAFWVEDYDGIAVLSVGGAGPNNIIFLEIDVEDSDEVNFVSDERIPINISDPIVFKCGAVYDENEYNDFVIGSSLDNLEVLKINMDDWTVSERLELSIDEGFTLSDIALGVLKTNDSNFEDDLVVATSNYYLITKMNLGGNKGFKE